MQMNIANSSLFMEGFPKNRKKIESESQLGAQCVTLPLAYCKDKYLRCNMQKRFLQGATELLLLFKTTLSALHFLFVFLIKDYFRYRR